MNWGSDPICRIQEHQTFRAVRAQNWPDIHITRAKITTSFSCMSHNVKKSIFGYWGGGCRCPFNNQTGPILLPSYPITCINLHIKYGRNPIRIYYVITIMRSADAAGDRVYWWLVLNIDESLTWKYHVQNINNKVSRSLFSIKQAKNFLPLHSLKTLYYSLIQPLLTYGILAWGNANTSIIHKTTMMQKKSHQSYQ